jgi:uncharacterized protein (DUF697 family)
VGALGHSLKLANLWRVVLEIDLQAIRREAHSPFDLLIAGEPVALAESLKRALAPGPHPWVRLAALGEAAADPVPHAVIVVTDAPPDAPDAAAALRRLRDARVPAVVVHVVPGVRAERLRVPGTVVVGELDAAGLAVAGAALMDAVQMDLRLALAYQLPALRPSYFDITIDETSRANATYALTTGVAEVVPVLNVPLNLGDMVILTKNQLLMGYRLALASGKDGDPRSLITELLGVLGGGLLFRQLARQLVGLIPVVGLIPKVAIAYGGTWAIGRAVALWLTEGRQVTGDTLRSLAADGLERGRTIARDLVSRRVSSHDRPAGRWSRLRSQLPGLGPRRTPPGPPAPKP